MLYSLLFVYKYSFEAHDFTALIMDKLLDNIFSVEKAQTSVPSIQSSKHSIKVVPKPSEEVSPDQGHEKGVPEKKSCRSLYDVILYGLQEAGRKTYLHRLVYIGKHKFKDSGEGNLEFEKFFQNSVNKSNNMYCDEPLTGCFIYYTNYFTHVVEGSEDSIGRHVCHIVGEMSKCDTFITTKIVFDSSHIRQRYFNAWYSMYAIPQRLLEKIKGDDKVKLANYQLKVFLDKLQSIANFLRSESDTLTDVSEIIQEKALSLLPETTLMEFLLKLDGLYPLATYAGYYEHFPHLRIEEEECWPALNDYVPYDVYFEEKPPEKLVAPPYFSEALAEVEAREQARRHDETTVAVRRSFVDLGVRGEEEEGGEEDEGEEDEEVEEGSVQGEIEAKPPEEEQAPEALDWDKAADKGKGWLRVTLQTPSVSSKGHPDGAQQPKPRESEEAKGERTRATLGFIAQDISGLMEEAKSGSVRHKTLTEVEAQSRRKRGTSHSQVPIVEAGRKSLAPGSKVLLPPSGPKPKPRTKSKTKRKMSEGGKLAALGLDIQL